PPQHLITSAPPLHTPTTSWATKLRQYSPTLGLAYVRRSVTFFERYSMGLRSMCRYSARVPGVAPGTSGTPSLTTKTVMGARSRFRSFAMRATLWKKALKSLYVSFVGNHSRRL